MGFRLMKDTKSCPSELELYIRNDFQRIGKSNVVGNLDHLLLFIVSED
jgi:hypothetical protein